jgi:hypothetical protein
MSHGGGGGFGHGGGGGHHGHGGGLLGHGGGQHGHVGGHAQLHLPGIPDQIPTWSSDEEVGRGYWGFLGNMTVGKLFGFLLMGLILWLFVVYGISHKQPGKSALADLSYFPTNKYAYSIEAASGQAAWLHDPQKPIGLSRGERQLRTSNGRIDKPSLSMPSRVETPTQEDLLGEPAPSAQYPFNSAFGIARHDILPKNILPDAWNMALGRKDEELIPIAASATNSPISASTTVGPGTSRLDLETSLGEVARVQAPQAIPLSLAKVLSSPLPPPQSILYSSTANRFVQSTTKVDAGGILRTRMIVSR